MSNKNTCLLLLMTSLLIMICAITLGTELNADFPSPVDLSAVDQPLEAARVRRSCWLDLAGKSHCGDEVKCTEDKKTHSIDCFIITTIALGSSRVSPHRLSLDGRIIGGTPADIKDYPYQLSFESRMFHVCGASIISSTYAVTGAHCTIGERVSDVRLRAGTSRVGSGGTLHPAAEIKMHSKYDNDTIDYDIALIRVTVKFPNGKLSKPIALASTEPAAGVKAVTSGWGDSSSGGQAPFVLRSVEVLVESRAKCNAAYAEDGGVTTRMICAGSSRKNACQGDSGGPLVVRGVLVGIVSWGYYCGKYGHPGVYSNVANLRGWIRDNSGV